MINRLHTAISVRLEQRRLRAAVETAAAGLFPDKCVRGGPFRGLRYPGWSSHGSAVFPKLLGTYEAELQGCVEEALAMMPPLVVDVGCAEGYYAVGCALRLPDSRVLAADASLPAQAMCREMAAINGVADRVETMGRIDRAGLLQFAALNSGWLICDCEGGEADLLDQEVFRALSDWFILVEMHEFVVPRIEERLIAEASETHDVQVIDSIDDYRRQQRWTVPGLDSLTPAIRHELYHEGRPGLMRWLWARPTKKSPPKIAVDTH
jgi:hypothetical protein